WGDDYQESNGRVAEQKQLQLKAIHRPRLKSPPSSSVGRRLSRVQWQSGRRASIEQKQLQLKAIHRPRFKSPSQLIPITNSTPPCNLLTRPWAGLGPRGPWQSGEA
ncbi:unnamed protein product, partial [Staurois parvus]